MKTITNTRAISGSYTRAREIAAKLAVAKSTPFYVARQTRAVAVDTRETSETWFTIEPYSGLEGDRIGDIKYIGNNIIEILEVHNPPFKQGNQ